MATSETCDLSASHAPKPEAIKSFKHLLPKIKHELVHMRHSYDKHEPGYFAGVSGTSDDELTSFDETDLVAVRAGQVAYGVIIFGKVKLPSSPGQYVFVRWFGGGEESKSGEKDYKFHSIYTEEKDDADGGKSFRAIMGDEDELFFFNE
ncbi:hypothetical protein BT63DRAFT_406728 [Microthyrium microscopicum]|uniref:Uncharacterized protein n=1 Tax=Microthyrium microscopicum TaxID=703497 RepID=A0A6A6TZ05_9PEZI|nr:hypothetical protein BT63DRAFT_406728 [Microthyrium microscopicum]